MGKWFKIWVRPFNEKGYWHPDFVWLNDMEQDDIMRPRHAHRVCEIAGINPGEGHVSVWSTDAHGYYVYPESARRMRRPFQWE